VCGVVVEEASREEEVTAAAERATLREKMRDLSPAERASLVPLLNKFFCYLFQADFEKPLCWRVLMSPASTVVRGGGRAPASKDSHLCWHKIAGGCCIRQHKGVLAASKNRFWPSKCLRHHRQASVS
jgi:hypothetical protein